MTGIKLKPYPLIFVYEIHEVQHLSRVLQYAESTRTLEHFKPLHHEADFLITKNEKRINKAQRVSAPCQNSNLLYK